MEYDVIEAKEWVHGAGCYPARIVLLKIKKAGGTEYSTHMQVDPTPDQKCRYVVSGHYFSNIFDAVEDFRIRNIRG